MRVLTLSMSFLILSFSSLIALATTSEQNTTKDGQIIETLMVIDSNEINAAKIALKRTGNADVKDFAQTMITDHSKNLQSTKALSQKIHINSVVTEQSLFLQKQGEEELKKLASIPAKKFDISFINAMVKDHKGALQIINATSAKTRNPELVKHLQATRDTVSHHLQMAREVRTKLEQRSAD